MFFSTKTILYIFSAIISGTAIAGILSIVPSSTVQGVFSFASLIISFSALANSFDVKYYNLNKKKISKISKFFSKLASLVGFICIILGIVLWVFAVESNAPLYMFLKNSFIESTNFIVGQCSIVILLISIIVGMGEKNK